MTLSQAKELWPVMRAWSEGKTVQWSAEGKQRFDCGLDRDLDFIAGPCMFRVKPQPRKFWVVLNQMHKPRVFTDHPGLSCILGLGDAVIEVVEVTK